MKRRDPSEALAEQPEPKKHHRYAPHVEAARRKYGLPITAADHAAYERGEYPAPRFSAADEWIRDAARREEELAWWRAHWAAEDERTGRWRIRRAWSG